jgi:hypothetical protein
MSESSAQEHEENVVGITPENSGNNSNNDETCKELVSTTFARLTHFLISF